MQRGRRLGTRGLGDVDEYDEGVRENEKELDVDKEGGFRFLLQYTLWDQGGENDGRGGESRERERESSLPNVGVAMFYNYYYYHKPEC